MFWLIIILLIVFVLVAAAYMLLQLPHFGGRISAERKAFFDRLQHYQNGKFQNLRAGTFKLNTLDFIRTTYDYYRGHANRQPSQPLPVSKLAPDHISGNCDQLTRLTWFGHSTFLLEIQGKVILLDPMFSETPNPHPKFGTRRYSTDLPLEVEQLPEIDAVIVSHDHFDHLDYPTITKLNGKVKNYYVPLGVSAHLEHWGVAKDRIHELDWWEEILHEDLKLVCTPAQHFSGRTPFSRESTLWASWVIVGSDCRIYFSGDSGYGSHFKEIGNRYGPFEIALMECGQYHEQWPEVHMMPEETIDAFLDVKGKLLMPIHWGAFTLSLHSWTDPIERITARALEQKLRITTPRIGEPIILCQQKIPTSRWWEQIH